MSTPILASPRATESQAVAFALEKGAPQWWAELVPIFWREAQKRGVDPAGAFAQSCKETGFAHFGRAVTERHHNPAGLKVRDPGRMADNDPKAHVTFASWTEGIRAFVDHLALYAGHPDYPKDWPDETPDQRQFASIHGKATTFEALGGNWAPNTTYGHEIVAMVRDMTGGTVTEQPKPTQVGDSPLVSKFVQARNYTRGPRTKGSILWIVLHDMEAPEKGETAENIAEYFRTTTRQASAHYNIDSNSIVQCVRESDIAWHAKGANARGIGLEHAGYANQTAADWSDVFSGAMLRLSAKLTAEICARYEIPVRFVNAQGLIAGESGITTHAEVSKAWPGSGHWDPGPNFPMKDYLEMVEASEEEEMPTAEEIAKATADEIERRMDHRVFDAGGSPLRGDYADGVEDRVVEGTKQRLEATDIIERKVNAIAENPGKKITFNADGTIAAIEDPS